MLEFLGWGDPGEQDFGQEVKIVLASAEFSKELTTSVLWLNDNQLDIRCVRMRPYDDDGQVLLDVQTVIPIPGTEEYQVQIREKRQTERVARQSARDFSKYDVSIGGNQYPKLNKRNMMFRLVSEALNNGGTLHQIMEAIPSGKFKVFEGALDAEQIREQLWKIKGELWHGLRDSSVVTVNLSRTGAKPTSCPISGVSMRSTQRKI